MAKSVTTWTWVKRTIIGVLIVANLGIGYALWQLRSVSQTIASFPTVPELAPVLDPAPDDPQDPITFLVLGSDSRENLPDDWVGDFGEFGGQRADVIMLVQVYPTTGAVRMLSLPRDLQTEIDGHGIQKVNAAFAFGGAALMVSTVRDELAIPVHHYAEIDFVGFAGLVDELGGITIDFPYAARDLKSGLLVEEGSQNLDGRTALAYARSRSYQELRDGSWVSSDANDIGRTGRQQRLLGAILSKLKEPVNVLGVQGLVAELGKFLTVDPDFSNIDLVGLAIAFRDFGAEDIIASTLPTNSELIDGIYYEIRDEPAATDAIGEFAGVSSILPDVVETETAPITIEVLNGNGVGGSAGEWAVTLEALGFDVVSVADHEVFDLSETQIVVLSGSSAGQTVRDLLGFGIIVEGNPGDVDAQVVLGADALARSS